MLRRRSRTNGRPVKSSFRRCTVLRPPASKNTFAAASSQARRREAAGLVDFPLQRGERQARLKRRPSCACRWNKRVSKRYERSLSAAERAAVRVSTGGGGVGHLLACDFFCRKGNCGVLRCGVRAKQNVRATVASRPRRGASFLSRLEKQLASTFKKELPQRNLFPTYNPSEPSLSVDADLNSLQHRPPPYHEKLLQRCLGGQTGAVTVKV